MFGLAKRKSSEAFAKALEAGSLGKHGTSSSRTFTFKRGNITLYPKGYDVIRTPIGVGGVVTKIYPSMEKWTERRLEKRYERLGILAQCGAPVIKPVAKPLVKNTKKFGSIVIWKEKQVRGVNLEKFLVKYAKTEAEKKRALKAYERAERKLLKILGGLGWEAGDLGYMNAVYNPKTNRVVFTDIDIYRG